MWPTFFSIIRYTRAARYDKLRILPYFTGYCNPYNYSRKWCTQGSMTELPQAFTLPNKLPPDLTLFSTPLASGTLVLTSSRGDKQVHANRPVIFGSTRQFSLANPRHFHWYLASSCQERRIGKYEAEKSPTKDGMRSRESDFGPRLPRFWVAFTWHVKSKHYLTRHMFYISFSPFHFDHLL